MATHSSTLAWKIPWMEEPGGLQSMGSLRVGQLSDFTFSFHFHALEKEMATHSSVLALRNSRDGGAWWAAVYGVAQRWTRLKRLSSSSRVTLGSNLEELADCFPTPFLFPLAGSMVPNSPHLSKDINLGFWIFKDRMSLMLLT